MLLSTQVGLFLATFVVSSNGAAISSRQHISPADAPQGKVIVFGDSLSDNGSILHVSQWTWFIYTVKHPGTGSWEVSNQTWPRDPAYVGHRFSNGPVWVENLAQRLGMVLDDSAVGGATSNNSVVQGFTGPGSVIPVPSAVDQVAKYLERSSVGDQDLVVIMIGANDAFFSLSVSGVIPAITHIIHTLHEKGAKKFLLASYPNLGRLPYRAFSTAATSTALQSLSFSLSRSLINLRYQLCRRPSDIQVGYVDVSSLFRDMMLNPLNFGFDPETVEESCLVGAYSEAPRQLCDDPDKFIFWDEYHPTRVVHRYIGSLAWKASQVMCDNQHSENSQ